MEAESGWERDNWQVALWWHKKILFSCPWIPILWYFTNLGAQDVNCSQASEIISPNAERILQRIQNCEWKHLQTVMPCWALIPHVLKGHIFLGSPKSMRILKPFVFLIFQICRELIMSHTIFRIWDFPARWKQVSWSNISCNSVLGSSTFHSHVIHHYMYILGGGGGRQSGGFHYEEVRTICFYWNSKNG